MTSLGGSDHGDGLEVDQNEDLDSALGSDIDSVGSASLTSSIVGYKYENGRRYHAYREGAYYLPNDESEQARLDLLHHIFCLSVNGALFLAPLRKEQIKRCLDIGTGTGIWAIDFADEYPDTEVVGTDLSPIQPAFVPPNVRFYVDDVEDEWAFPPDQAFDFIHCRMMGGSVADWKRLFQQAYTNLKPGGWFETQEFEAHYLSDDDPNLEKCANLRDWINLINEGSAKFGKEIDVAKQQKGYFEEAGFANITETIVRVPMGSWPKGKRYKEMGIYNRENTLECVHAFTIQLFTHVLGWTLEECEVLMAKVRDEIKDSGNHLYINYHFVYGKRPEDVAK